VSDDKSGSKVCRDCGVAKAVTEFWMSKASRDGRAPYCKVCFTQRNALSGARRAAKAGREIRPRSRAPSMYPAA
jgi:transposase-like protein